MSLTGDERREVFGEIMSVDRRLMQKIEAVAKCARAKITWQVLVLFVALAASAIGFVWYNLGGGIGENRAACTANARDVSELGGDVRAIRESFEDFRAEQRAVNKAVMEGLTDVRQRLPK